MHVISVGVFVRRAIEAIGVLKVAMVDIVMLGRRRTVPGVVIVNMRAAQARGGSDRAATENRE